MGRFLCLDIEAIRDDRVWTPPDRQSDARVAMKFNDDQNIVGTLAMPQRELFAPPFAWRPLCIGLVLIAVEKGKPAVVERIGVLDVPKDGDKDAWERDLLVKFDGVLKKSGWPEIVTWNGRGFDIPVLMLRSLRYGVQHPWYYESREARYRYSEDRHCDLADAMSDHGATHKLSLDGIARLIGLPGKYGPFDGDGVAQAFIDGRHKEIASYCLSDAVQLAFVFMRWQLLKGTISIESYRATASQFLTLCLGNVALGIDFISRVDRKVLLLEPDEVAAAVPAPEAA